MNRHRLFWMILVLLGFVGVNAAALLVFDSGARIDVRNAYDCLTTGVQHGFVRRTHFDEKGDEHRYVVFVPNRIEPGVRPPLLVFLHGVALEGQDGVRHIHECLGSPLWKSRSTFPFVVLFPQCPVGSSWSATSATGQLVMSLVHKTQREYNTDSDRTYLTGVSSGGTGAWSLASAHNDVFAAVVPISGTPIEKEAAKILADAQLPIWNFYVHGDGPEEANHRMHDDLLKEGASPLFTEIDGTLSDKWWKHNAWGVAYHSQATFSWLLTHSRSANVVNSGRRFRTIFAGEQIDDSSRAGSVNWSVDKEGILRFDLTPACRPSVMSYNASFRNYELHFEFRYDQAREFELLFPSADGKEIVFKVTHPEHGSGGAYYTADQKCIQMPDPTAQRGLHRQIWNDVRVRIQDDHVLMEVNGSRFHDLKHDGFLARSGVFSIKVDSADTSIQYRHFRIREVN